MNYLYRKILCAKDSPPVNYDRHNDHYDDDYDDDDEDDEHDDEERRLGSCGRGRGRGY